jgi:SPP1 gp7 family putative phage head morphogenesis protein
MAIRDPWEPLPRVEHRYFRSLKDVTDWLRKAIEGELNPYLIVRTLRTAIVNPVFQRYTEETARNMITQVLVTSAVSWRHAASESSRGRLIYQALRKEMQGPVGVAVRERIQQNAELIRSVPMDFADRMTAYIAQQTQAGRRASDIAQDLLDRFPEMSTNKVQLIARTEVGKTSTALTRARAENLGLDWYEWRTSEDSRVRDSHRHMDRVLVKWTDPPAPEALIGERSTLEYYHAGECPNCRCYPAPVTDLDRITWPHKVYTGGAIRTLVRAAFEKMNSRG